MKLDYLLYFTLTQLFSQSYTLTQTNLEKTPVIIWYLVRNEIRKVTLNVRIIDQEGYR